MSMFLKVIPRQRVIIQKEEILQIFRLILQGKLIKGDCVERFEAKFADYIGTKFALCVASGRLGLELILKSLDLEKGDEILLPAYTFHIVPEVIKNAGFTPVFIDINEEDHNIDVRFIEKNITQRTKAIIATHLFGKPCELYKILEIAKRHNLFVIEDCAQAIGAEYYNKKVGSFSGSAYFSFETVKPLHTFGGGMIVTNNYLLFKKIKNSVETYAYPKFFKIIKKIVFTVIESLLTHPFFFTVFIYPLLLFAIFLNKDLIKFAKKTKGQFKLVETRYSNFQASIGLSKLERLDRQLEKRITNARFLIEKLNKNIPVQKLDRYTKSIFYYFVIQSGDNYKLSKALLKKGIDVATHIAQDCSKTKDSELEYPVARRANDTALQIPIYPQLSKRDINRIAEILNRNFK